MLYTYSFHPNILPNTEELAGQIQYFATTSPNTTLAEAATLDLKRLMCLLHRIGPPHRCYREGANVSKSASLPVKSITFFGVCRLLQRDGYS